MNGWPEPGSAVVVSSARTPSRTPRDPRPGVVDHVARLSFTVDGLDAVFTRSAGRSEPIRRAAGAFGSDTYVAVDARSDRGRAVLDAGAWTDAESAAVNAVQAWLADRPEPARHTARDALDALDPDRPRTEGQRR